jgi:hypothetical protein
MPTRKQRRRREKELRHEYVWEDEEGNVLEPDEVPPRRGDSARRAAPARGPREVQPPSWRRTLKRGLVFAPVMFIVVMLFSGDMTLANQLVQTAIIVGIFVPFSYFFDGVLWRSHKRRNARHADAGRGS